MTADVLDTGPNVRRRARPRLLAGLGAVLLAGAAIWSAARSNPEPDPAPPPVAEVRPPGGPAVVGLAVGTDTVYALVGRCADFSRLGCTQELWSRSGTGGWTPSAARLPPTGQGFPVRVVAGSAVAVVDVDAQQVYVVRGAAVARRALTAGPAAREVPPGSVLEQDGPALYSLDPATGVRSRLAAQPPVGVLQDVRATGPVIGATGRGPGGAVLAAFSRDGGGRWTAAPVRGLRPDPQVANIAVAADGTAYLLVGRGPYPARGSDFSELWRWDGRRWTDVTPRDRPATAQSIVVHAGRLLVTEAAGGTWELQPDGTLLRLPDAAGGLRPTFVLDGPPGLLLAYAAGDRECCSLLTSRDRGRSWELFTPR